MRKKRQDRKKREGNYWEGRGKNVKVLD